MIDENSIAFFNNRLTYNLSDLKKLTPSQQDRVRVYGTQAENLLKNRDLAMFIHHFKFDMTDTLIAINGYNEESNNEKIAMANQLKGIDNFINSLKRAVVLKNRLGNTDKVPE